MKELIALREKARDRAAALIKDSLSKIEVLHLQGGQDKEILFELITIKDTLDLFPNESKHLLKGLTNTFEMDINYLSNKFIDLTYIKNRVSSIAADMALRIKDGGYKDEKTYLKPIRMKYED